MCPYNLPGRYTVCMLVMLLLIFTTVSLQGQDQDPPPKPDASQIIDDASFKPQLGEGPIVWALFEKSKLVNSVILILSVIAFLLFFYFLFTIKGQTMAPRVFVDEVMKLLHENNYSGAAEYARANQQLFIGSIVQRCLENKSKSHSVLMAMIDTEGNRRADIEWNRISYLADVSNVAPMLGLLGTVLGMIDAFFYALPESTASISSQALSRSIGGAMATTMFGLIVGIIALVFYSIVKGRLTQALADSQQIVHAITDHIKRQES